MFTPTFHLKSVLQIDEAFLRENRIEGLILDVDNTLSLQDSPTEERGVTEWLAKMRELGVKTAVVSNNTKKRVKPLADKLGLEFVHFGCKPLPFGIRKGAKLLGLPNDRIAMVGDQILSDVIGGSLSGVKTILTDPLRLEMSAGARIRRKIETRVFSREFNKTEK